MPAEKMKKSVEATAKTAKATEGSVNPSTVKGKKTLYQETAVNFQSAAAEMLGSGVRALQEGVRDMQTGIKEQMRKNKEGAADLSSRRC